MCCNGTLYLHVTLTDDDVQRLEKHPLTLETRDEQPAIIEPCLFHDGKACTVYCDRPDSCRRYLCELLRAGERDEITDVESLLIIEEAKALVEIVKEHVVFEAGKPLAVSVWSEPPIDAPAESRLAWTRVLQYLRRHFLSPQA